MKKFLSAVLSLTLAFGACVSLAACDKDKETSSSSSEGTLPVEVEDAVESVIAEALKVKETLTSAKSVTVYHSVSESNYEKDKAAEYGEWHKEYSQTLYNAEAQSYLYEDVKEYYVPEYKVDAYSDDGILTKEGKTVAADFKRDIKEATYLFKNAEDGKYYEVTANQDYVEYYAKDRIYTENGIEIVYGNFAEWNKELGYEAWLENAHIAHCEWRTAQQEAYDEWKETQDKNYAEWKTTKQEAMDKAIANGSFTATDPDVNDFQEYCEANGGKYYASAKAYYERNDAKYYTSLEDYCGKAWVGTFKDYCEKYFNGYYEDVEDYCEQRGLNYEELYEIEEITKAELIRRVEVLEPMGYTAAVAGEVVGKVSALEDIKTVFNYNVEKQCYELFSLGAYSYELKFLPNNGIEFYQRASMMDCSSMAIKDINNTTVAVPTEVIKAVKDWNTPVVETPAEQA